MGETYQPPYARVAWPVYSFARVVSSALDGVSQRAYAQPLDAVPTHFFLAYRLRCMAALSECLGTAQTTRLTPHARPRTPTFATATARRTRRANRLHQPHTRNSRARRLPGRRSPARTAQLPGAGPSLQHTSTSAHAPLSAAHTKGRILPSLGPRTYIPLSTHPAKRAPHIQTTHAFPVHRQVPARRYIRHPRSGGRCLPHTCPLPCTQPAPAHFHMV